MGYKLYRDEMTGNYQAIMAYVTLNRKVHSNFKEKILEKDVKVCFGWKNFNLKKIDTDFTAQ